MQTIINGAGRLEPTFDQHGKKTGYRFRFSLGKNPITGKYDLSPWRSVRGSKAKALAAMAKYRSEIEQGISLNDTELCFGAFAARYCEQREALGSVSPSMLRHDRQHVATLNQYLEFVRLRDITAAGVQAVMAELGKAGRTPGAIRRMLAILKRIMREACDLDIILRNPCDKIRPPKVTRQEISFLDGDGVLRLIAALEKYSSEVIYPDEAEQERLKEQRQNKHSKKPIKRMRANSLFACELQTISRHSHTMAVFIALATGARRGEVLGLVWGALDDKAQTLSIKQSYAGRDGIRPTKTVKGKRTVSIGSGILDSLRQWQRRQAEYLLLFGIRQNDTTPIITNEIGGFTDPAHFSRWWRDFRETYGFMDLRFHDLRHTQASLLVSQGMDIVTIQNRLGHEKASTTLDLYAHLLPQKDREAAEIVGALMGQNKPNLGKVVSW